MEYSRDGVDYVASRVGLRVPTRLWAYIVAWFVLVPTQAFLGALTLQTIYLNVFNALIVAIAAGAMEKPQKGR